MENNSARKFVLIPVDLWKSEINNSRDQSSVSSIPTTSFFNKKPEKDPETSIESETKEEKVSEKDPNVNIKTNSLLEYLYTQVGKDHQKKKILQAIFDCKTIKLSNTYTLIVNNVDTQVKILDFITHLRRRTGDFSDVYLLILRELNLNPRLINNKRISKNERENWITYTF